MPHRITALLALLFALLGGCSTLPPGSDYPKQSSKALEEPLQTRLGRQMAERAAPQQGKSGFRIISAGVDAFLARAEMIDAAERTLDMQYYIYKLDQTGQLLTEAILRAADRGVRVRLLVDDGDTAPGDERIMALEAHPNIELRVFNPFAYRGHSNFFRALEFLASGGRVDYRMHNKLIVVDNAIALVGGRNVGDEYFQIDPQAQFGDDDVFATGPIVRDMSASFDEFWNCARSIPGRALTDFMAADAALLALRGALAEHKHVKKAEGVDYVARLATREPLAGMLSGALPLVWANAVLVYDSPEKRSVVKGEAPGRTTSGPVIDAASVVQSELLIVTPFFVPGREGMNLFAQLRARDVDVRVLTNSLESTPELLVHSAYITYRRRLLEQGISLYEVRARLGNSRGSGQSALMSSYGNYALHAKLFVFDRRRVFIGSMNFDQRSARINTEIGLLIDSPELAQQTAQRFEAISRPENSYGLRLDPPDREGPPRLTWTTRENGQWLELSTEPARSQWQRFKVRLFSLLPLDDEL